MRPYHRYSAMIMSGLSVAFLKSRSHAARNSGPRASTSSSVGRNLPAGRRCQSLFGPKRGTNTHRHP
jgi:hypothetical protein